MSSRDRDDYDSEGLDELSDVDQPVAPTTQRQDKSRAGRWLERPSAQDEERIDYDEDDDEEEEDDEDYDDSGKRNPRKKKRRQNIFLDVEAEVDEDEEEEEEDGEDLEGFIQEEGEEAAAAAEARRGARHRALDRDRETQQEFNPEEMAARLSAKYGKRDTYHRRGAPGAAAAGAMGGGSGAGNEAYEQDADYIPQKFLMPGVQDPNLWMVKCIPGKEKDIMLKLMHRYFDNEYSDRPLDILSAFCRDSLKGYIYIEARKQAYVQAAIDRINGLFASTIMLVPINEMVDVVKIRRREAQLQPGSWVRVKRGKYAGDLARVIGVEDALDKVEIRLIPRLDYGNQHREAADTDDAAKKRKKGGFPYSNPNEPRPPQRMFNPREADKLDRSKPLMARGRGVYVYGADMFRDGFLEKAVKINSLITQNVNPTLDEITKFSTADGGDEEEQALSLSALAGSAATETLSAESIRPGDNVEVTEGDMVHVHGIVTSVDGDVAHVRPLVEGLPDSLRFPIRQLRKRFRTGDHVRVVSGHHTGETGMIVTVADNVVTLLSDLSVKEVTVFARDLRDAADAGTMAKSVTVSGNFELYDFVTLENNAVAVIVKIEGDNFQIMDQDGDVRLVKGAQMTPRRNTRNAAATDAHNNVIRVGDQVRELDSVDRRSGNVLHLNRRYCFMRSREILEHGGVFVAPTRKVAAVGRGAAGINGNGMTAGSSGGGFLHPGGMRGGMRGGRGRGAGVAGNPFHQRRGPRDRLISATVMITKGPYKSYIGIVKDAAGDKARVELHTNSRLISIDKDSLVVQDRFGKFVPLHDMPELMGPPSSAMMRGLRGYGDGQMGSAFGSSGSGHYGSSGASRYNDGSATPAYNSGGSRTPAHYSGGRTPMHRSDDGSRTPFHINDGSRTPAWDSGSRTPNPQAWGASSGGDSSVGGDAWDAGSRTPHWGGGGEVSDSGLGSSWETSSDAGFNPNTPSAGNGWGAADTLAASGTTATGAAGGSWSESTVSGWETDGTTGNGLPVGTTPATPAWGDDSRSMSNTTASGRRSMASAAPTPNPSSSNFPATPAANYAPMTPQAPEYPMTPAAGMGSGGIGAPTPGARYPPQTPAAYSHPTPGAMMPATPAPGSAAVPQTPFASGGLDYSSGGGHRADNVATPAASFGGRPPAMASSTAAAAGGGNRNHLPRDWLSRGIVVEVVRATSGAEPVPAKTQGVVLRVLGGKECDIRVLECSSEHSLINSTQVVSIDLVRPARPARSDQVKLLGPKERGAVGKLIAIDGDDAIVKAGNSSDFVVQPIHFVAKYMEV